jgi:hypothetical protein
VPWAVRLVREALAESGLPVTCRPGRVAALGGARTEHLVQVGQERPDRCGVGFGGQRLLAYQHRLFEALIQYQFLRQARADSDESSTERRHNRRIQLTQLVERCWRVACLKVCGHTGDTRRVSQFVAQ